MSMKRRQPGGDQPPRVVAELNGKRVRIGGYVVPLDFEATTIKEFLLVPFVGACIHVPPPPANQIVYVKADKGFADHRPVRSRLGHRHHQDRDGVHRARRCRLHAGCRERRRAARTIRICPREQRGSEAFAMGGGSQPPLGGRGILHPLPICG